MEYYSDPDYLKHYGILGMKRGVRRFQNPDGSLTTEGQKRYGVTGKTKARQIRKIDRRFGTDTNSIGCMIHSTCDVYEKASTHAIF